MSSKNKLARDRCAALIPSIMATTGHQPELYNLLYDTTLSCAADEVKVLSYQAFSATIDIPTNLHHETPP
jgi:hypothetical protein